MLTDCAEKLFTSSFTCTTRPDSLDGSLQEVHSNRPFVVSREGSLAEALDETALADSAVSHDNNLSAVVQLLHHCALDTDSRMSYSSTQTGEREGDSMRPEEFRLARFGEQLHSFMYGARSGRLWD